MGVQNKLVKPIMTAPIITKATATGIVTLNITELVYSYNPTKSINQQPRLNRTNETGGQAAVLAVNLSVNSAEEADKVALNLITAALTFAQEAIPAALAVYNHQKVVPESFYHHTP